MSNADEGFVILSGIRSGLRREFEFAVRARAGLSPDLGRTRSRKRPSDSSSIDDGESTERESEARADAPPRSSRFERLYGAGADESTMERVSKLAAMLSGANPYTAEASPATKSKGFRDSVGESMDFDLMMQKKAKLNMKELLETGLLEDLPVKYIACTKKQVWLKGVIRGTGILCYCASCKGSKVISAYLFGQHAGSTKKFQLDFICLDNGTTIGDILESCKLVPSEMLESTIRKAIGPVSLNEPSVCHKCKCLTKAYTGNPGSVCDSCLQLDQLQTTPPPTGNDGFVSTYKYISSKKKSTGGRLTKKDLGLHKLVFMGDTLPQGTEVGYYVQGQRKLKGHIKDTGIFCSCCNTVVSPSQFEAHAGQAQRRKPYNYIYTSNGVSLHELSVSLSKGRKLSASENDDLCSICADGGNLLLCDLCPRAFHTDCVGLSSIPEGDWYCQYCRNMHQREKCVEYNDNAIAAGRVEGVDPIEQIFKRCIRIVETPDTNVVGCVFCRCHDFSRSGFGPRTVLLCDQCEKEYHVGCLKDHKMGVLKEIPDEDWFCSSDCSRIHDSLQNFVIDGVTLIHDVDSNIIKSKCNGKESNKVKIDAKWGLLRGRINADESKPLLSKAVSIFHESFAPIEDSTGRDLIPDMVFGRNTNFHDFGGMYCAILTVDSSVVSVGVLRVLGGDVAELPLVATKADSQGQGYFQSLFACIERLLVSMKVKHFVLPAAEETESIWTNKFGFTKITPEKLHEYIGGACLMVFQGTPMLHKPVLPWGQ